MPPATPPAAPPAAPPATPPALPPPAPPAVAPPAEPPPAPPPVPIISIGSVTLSDTWATTPAAGNWEPTVWVAMGADAQVPRCSVAISVSSATHSGLRTIATTTDPERARPVSDTSVSIAAWPSGTTRRFTQPPLASARA
ncbi:MAG: hypothetical protein IPJ65_33110 [Archangiaceae bacterium]|nr:hypothetical protein [Archangiaceae bacterium]